MKSFADYLAESKKTYDFKIGIAGELPEGFVDKMEMSLKKFGVEKLSAGKKTPIQERPLDFPNLDNMEVTYFETTISYPTTSHVMQEYIGSCCDVPSTHVIVRSPNEPQEQYQNEQEDKEYVAILTQEEMEAESAQPNVGGDRIMDLLKELETARKERENDYVGDVPVGSSKDIDDSENKKSTIGA